MRLIEPGFRIRNLPRTTQLKQQYAERARGTKWRIETYMYSNQSGRNTMSCR